ncbi:hypothetical protein [Brevundimonas aurantiaca]|uniref:hypothetical protein n=1 Tax=Brevundimonas aurantiaca TaxID=74316 RepID=UPI003016F533
MNRLLVLSSVLASLALGDAAIAQASGPIGAADVVGEWSLSVTPAPDSESRITFKGKDGSERLNFPLRITAQPRGRLACVLDGESADCRIRNGDLIVVYSGGGVRLIYTLTDRARDGFRGSAAMRVRLLPVGGRIGDVRMVRR